MFPSRSPRRTVRGGAAARAAVEVNEMTLPQGLLAVSALLAVAVLLAVVARRIHIQLTVVLAVVGFAAGAVARGLGTPPPLQGEGFEEVVVFAFLPVLVFAAVLGLSVRTFFRNLWPILALATVALGVSAALVGGAVHAALDIPLATAFLFGALISATDPVAVVAVFRELGVPERLLILVEGESLLNDGVAIVAFEVLLAAALGNEASLLGGVSDFVAVFFGGAAIGAVVGLAAAGVLPWLDRLGAAALSVAVAYGSFVLADDVLGFSGVMATVGAGLVIGGLAPSRASAEVREAWDQLWESLDYIANAVLFLLIGLVIDPALLVTQLRAIALAVVVVLVARALAVVPLVSALQRFAGVTRVGKRNEAVLVWGGLRGAVALALALALPEELAQRDALVAMTGGVVLATLLINATTISALVSRLRLNRPSRTDQFLTAAARLSAVRVARGRLKDLDLDDSVVRERLTAAERSARQELEALGLDEGEQMQAVMRRGLAVERATYQRLSDAGLLPPTSARTLLHEVDDQAEELGMGRPLQHGGGARPQPWFDRLVRRLVDWLPAPVGEDPAQLDYAEASARRLAAQRTGEALSALSDLPNVDAAAVGRTEDTFQRWEAEAVATLAKLGRGAGDEGRALRRQQAEAMSRVAAVDALAQLCEAGVLSPTLAESAADEVSRQISGGVTDRLGR
jgi:CPA1 family monovalent cation:H+ antiporter